MSTLESEIDRHYGAEDISTRILRALAGAGQDVEALTRADLAPCDEFHGGGIASTRELARFAYLAPATHVLDIGCGVGGLEVVTIEDTTAAVIASGRKRRAALAAQDPQQLTINVIVPDQVETKMDIVLRNNQEGRTITIKALFARRT